MHELGQVLENRHLSGAEVLVVGVVLEGAEEGAETGPREGPNLGLASVVVSSPGPSWSRSRWCCRWG